MQWSGLDALLAKGFNEPNIFFEKMRSRSDLQT
jgi:hypothetical protein